MASLNRLPGVAEVAMQAGIHAARTIDRRLKGNQSAKPFRYRDLGSAATIARFRAVVSFKGVRVGGFIGWVIWAFIHLTFLTGFKNRGTALVKWVTSFVGSARDERTITIRQATARIIAMEAGVKPGEEDLARYIIERKPAVHARSGDPTSRPTSAKPVQRKQASE
jgi:NADH dehydrogenase